MDIEDGNSSDDLNFVNLDFDDDDTAASAWDNPKNILMFSETSTRGASASQSLRSYGSTVTFDEDSIATGIASHSMNNQLPANGSEFPPKITSALKTPEVEIEAVSTAPSSVAQSINDLNDIPNDSSQPKKGLESSVDDDGISAPFMMECQPQHLINLDEVSNKISKSEGDIPMTSNNNTFHSNVMDHTPVEENRLIIKEENSSSSPNPILTSQKNSSLPDEHKDSNSFTRSPSDKDRNAQNHLSLSEIKEVDEEEASSSTPISRKEIQKPAAVTEAVTEPSFDDDVDGLFIEPLEEGLDHQQEYNDFNNVVNTFLHTQKLINENVQQQYDHDDSSTITSMQSSFKANPLMPIQWQNLRNSENEEGLPIPQNITTRTPSTKSENVDEEKPLITFEEEKNVNNPSRSTELKMSDMKNKNDNNLETIPLNNSIPPQHGQNLTEEEGLENYKLIQMDSVHTTASSFMSMAKQQKKTSEKSLLEPKAPLDEEKNQQYEQDVELASASLLPPSSSGMEQDNGEEKMQKEFLASQTTTIELSSESKSSSEKMGNDMFLSSRSLTRERRGMEEEMLQMSHNYKVRQKKFFRNCFIFGFFLVVVALSNAFLWIYANYNDAYSSTDDDTSLSASGSGNSTLIQENCIGTGCGKNKSNALSTQTPTELQLRPTIIPTESVKSSFQSNSTNSTEINGTLQEPYGSNFTVIENNNTLPEDSNHILVESDFSKAENANNTFDDNNSTFASMHPTSYGNTSEPSNVSLSLEAETNKSILVDTRYRGDLE